MFETCDWNDEGEDPTPSPTAEKEKASCAQEKGLMSRKKRLKRNRQLLEVLRTLNTPSALHPDLPSAPEAPTPKRQKKTTKDVICPEPSPPEDAPETERPLKSGEERLSRQQWKNKLKNKRRNKNKFKVVTVTGGETEGQEGTTARDRGAEATENPPKIKSQQPRGKRTGGTAGKGNPLPDRGQECPSPSESKQPVTRPLRAGELRTSGDEDGRPPHQVTPRERARLKKLKKIMQRGGGTETPSEEDPGGTSGDPEQPETDNSEAGKDQSSELRSRMEQRLSSARFRYINQQLYTSSSQDALSLFQEDPEAFTIYHSGFSQQVQRWPVNPITEIIKYIKNRSSSLVVADFGCGDALLARSVRNKVHSFDLVALNDHVTVCDIAEVPLSDGSVDVGVFCLSLMGNNLCDFLLEANRVLKPGGVLLVAEVSSRFDDVRQFLSAMSQLGFKAVTKRTETSHFFLFEFSKTGAGRDASKHPGLQLKPCLYKKR